MRTSGYFLPPHVRACWTEDALVFLDLRRQRYVGLSASQSSLVADLVANWPPAPQQIHGLTERVGTQDASVVAHALARRGLLTHEPSAAVSVASVPTSDLDGALPLEPPSRLAWKWHHVRRIVAAYLRARIMLRMLSLHSIVRIIASRKHARVELRTAFDMSKAQTLLDIYVRLRPLLFTAKNQCLLDSLVLVEYLAAYELFPLWVMGVRTGPFGAHSWVQQDSIAFNASAEYSRSFSPILAV